MLYPKDSPLWKFRDQLLRDTIKWCVDNSVFYRKRFRHISDDFSGVEDIYRLPVLKRDDITDNLSDFLCDSETQPAHLQYTTGTTGKFLPLQRSQEESRFISEFFSRKANEVALANGLKPLWLALTSTYHGSPTPVPGNSYVLNAGVYDGTQAAQAFELLKRDWHFPGVESKVSSIVGGDILLKALTGYILSQGIDPSSLGVKRLIVTGGYITPGRKKLLSQIWGATLQDRYSLSEIFGGATEIGIGGPWTFDAEVIPEVVHPYSLNPIDKGVGVLVLTGLYPFMQMMPLVRYYTGDLVKIIKTQGTDSEQLLVRFLGRERRAVLDATDNEVQPLILPGPLHDILESYPDIGASGRFLDVPSGMLQELAGKLHYSVEHKIDRPGHVSEIKLKLGLRYPPQLYPNRVTQIITEIRNALYEQCPMLMKRISEGGLDFLIDTETYDKVPAFNSK